jgi:DNA helicase-2/ATP-dependent DNA helicase PcrA
VVFLSGMEEGLFPHIMSSQQPLQLEEERRLCYVGMTRAMVKLYLTYSETRYLRGQEMNQRSSRFIREIPEEYVSEVRLKANVSRPTAFRQTFAQQAAALPPLHTAWRKEQQASGDGLALGQRVRHPQFGEGIVLALEGSGNHARVQVRFKAAGTKWLVMSYAKLEVV